jgi:hypothetical protein
MGKGTGRNGAETANQATKRWAWGRAVLILVTVVWTSLMLASLHWRFLDRFTAGTYHGRIAIDFFQTPRGFQNLVNGNNLFLSETVDFGPYTTSYFYHPAMVLAIGPWTAPFSPWVAYGLFVAVSVLLLWATARLLASAFDGPNEKAFAYFALFCTIPTYLLLWNGQAHVLLVVGVGMILAGLMRLAKDREAERYLRWIQCGVLISLLSKPMVLLMLPVLFVVPEVRKKLVWPVVIYAVVSLAFLIVPRLNPGGYNAQHWLNMVQVSSSPVQICGLAVPSEDNYSSCWQIYDLPVFLSRTLSGSVPSFVYKIPLLVILVASVSPLLFAKRLQRIRMTIAVIGMCILSQYLCYYLTYEYHYTTMLPLLPTLLWMRQNEKDRWPRWLLTICFVVLLTIFLPTFYVFVQKEGEPLWRPSAVLRVVPAITAFALLAAYVILSAWKTVRGNGTVVIMRIVTMSQGAARPAAVIGVLLFAVLTVAFLTAPDRLLATPSQWTRDNFREHFEDVLSRPVPSPMARYAIHRSLAFLYKPTDPDLAGKHFEAGHQALLEEVDFLVSVGREAEALELLSGESPKDLPKNIRERYEELKKKAEVRKQK